MTKKIDLSWEEVFERSSSVVDDIAVDFYAYGSDRSVKLFPVPRGGIHACQSIVAANKSNRLDLLIVEDHREADAYVDDIVDSGSTKTRMLELEPKPFYCLVDKQRDPESFWYTFPWERMNGESGGPEENIRRLIEYIGDNPEREGLKETPHRVIRSYKELFSGYGKDPAEVMKVFEDGACDEMVVVRNIEMFSCCEHHMLPFFGRAHIAYVPDKRVLGVSKVIRLLEIFSRRLQIQERLCQQVTSALDTYLQPRGSACLIIAQHLCMTCRGVQKQHSEMVTSSLTGVFREKGEARSEFLSIARG